MLENTFFLKNRFNLKVTELNEKLCNTCWTPKLHKDPTKIRFIITAPKSSVKPHSKAAITALNLIYNQIEHYNFKTQYNSVAETLWLVQNNQALIDVINKLNSRNKLS